MQHDVSEDPQKAWELALRLVAAAQDDSALGYVAAGRLEDLLRARRARYRSIGGHRVIRVLSSAADEPRPVY